MHQRSVQLQAVLEVFADGQWHYGQEIVKVTGVTGGTVYPMLTRLYVRNRLERRWEDPEIHHREGRSRRLYYRLAKDSGQTDCD